MHWIFLHSQNQQRQQSPLSNHLFQQVLRNHLVPIGSPRWFVVLLTKGLKTTNLFISCFISINTNIIAISIGRKNTKTSPSNKPFLFNNFLSMFWASPKVPLHAFLRLRLLKFEDRNHNPQVLKNGLQSIKSTNLDNSKLSHVHVPVFVGFTGGSLEKSICSAHFRESSILLF